MPSVKLRQPAPRHLRITYSYTDEKGNPATGENVPSESLSTSVITLVGVKQSLLKWASLSKTVTQLLMPSMKSSSKGFLKGRPEGLIANWTFDDGIGDKVTESISIFTQPLRIFKTTKRGRMASLVNPLSWMVLTTTYWCLAPANWIYRK